MPVKCKGEAVIKKLIVLLTTGFLASCMVGCSAAGHAGVSYAQADLPEDFVPELSEEQTVMCSIRVTAGDSVLEGVLYDNPTAQEFAKMLPLTVDLWHPAPDFARAFDLPEQIKEKGTPGYQYEPGSLAYWDEGPSVALIYQASREETVVPVVPIGKITSDTSIFQEYESEITIDIDTDQETERNEKTMTNAALPEELIQIPEGYFEESGYPGTLVELEYDTYESMTYEEQEQVLHKRAIVYLPYGYSEEEKYNVFYLMHGGWSNETTYLGTPDHPAAFKNVLDHGIADGVIQPMIVVCPTYNNTSPDDSGDYSLALRLTDNYHRELTGDLIPAVEGAYSTYAEDTTPEGIRSSRDHRAFAGFSMGSVATWRTFQYCLDEFRYFMPSSGNLTSDGEYMASMVRESGHTWNDFFIFAASGTDDFAYSSFKDQIEAMADVSDGTFRYADNERNGNLYFLEKEGGVHSGEYAMEYFYNGLCWIWQP